MLPDPIPTSRAFLFELLRQQNLSETTSDRLRRFSVPSIGQNEAALLRSMAAKSWAAPRFGAGRR